MSNNKMRRSHLIPFITGSDVIFSLLEKSGKTLNKLYVELGLPDTEFHEIVAGTKRLPEKVTNKLDAFFASLNLPKDFWENVGEATSLFDGNVTSDERRLINAQKRIIDIDALLGVFKGKGKNNNKEKLMEKLTSTISWDWDPANDPTNLVEIILRGEGLDWDEFSVQYKFDKYVEPIVAIQSPKAVGGINVPSLFIYGMVRKWKESGFSETFTVPKEELLRVLDPSEFTSPVEEHACYAGVKLTSPITKKVRTSKSIYYALFDYVEAERDGDEYTSIPDLTLHVSDVANTLFRGDLKVTQKEYYGKEGDDDDDDDDDN